MTDNYVSGASLLWLSTLLEERFGLPFRLQQHGRSSLQLSLVGSSKIICTALDLETYARWDSDLPCATWCPQQEGWVGIIDGCLPAPGVEALPSPLISPTTDGFHIAYDIFGLTYWMLTRQEEIGRQDLDEHNRFPATASHAYKHGYLERPLVDEWLAILGQVIQRVWPEVKLKQHDFQMRVSHDVDNPSPYAFKSLIAVLRVMAGHMFKRRNIRATVQALCLWLSSRTELQRSDPNNSFDWIMDVSERHGLSSAFYFICGRTDALMDAEYEIEHPAIRHLMRKIAKRGHEIGLHPSYGSYRSPAIIDAEAKRLLRVMKAEGVSQPAWGGRMHYLRWQQPTTLNAWAAAGMNYDSTLGYADRPGFRCGTCFEYPAFDPVADQALSLRIRPLIAMECTIMSANYMGLGTGTAALAKFTELKDKCRAVEGCYTLLWHNSQFESKEKRQMYEAVVAH